MRPPILAFLKTVAFSILLNYDNQLTEKRAASFTVGDGRSKRRNRQAHMHLFCSLLGCRPEKGTCRCKRCGRDVHVWEIVSSNMIRQEMIGRSKDKCVYQCTFLEQETCARCGVTREQKISKPRYY